MTLSSVFVFHCREPLVFFGEPGTGKLNCASLVHFGSKARAHPLAAIDCARLGKEAPVLFGRGKKKGLLEDLSGGTIVLTNIHQVCQSSISFAANQIFKASTVRHHSKYTD